MKEQSIKSLGAYLPNVESGHSGPAARLLLQHWKESKGVEDLSLIDFSSVLVWFHGAIGKDEAPPILSIGKDTLTAHILAACASENGDADDLIGKDYRRFAGQAYREALESGAPHFSHVSAVYESASGDVFDLQYERLILPYRTRRTARRHLLLLTIPLECQLIDRKRDREAPRPYSPPATILKPRSLHPSAQVVAPS